MRLCVKQPIQIHVSSIQPAACCRKRRPAVAALFKHINLIPIILRFYNSQTGIFRDDADRLIVRIRLGPKVDVGIRAAGFGIAKDARDLLVQTVARYVIDCSVDQPAKNSEEDANCDQRSLETTGSSLVRSRCRRSQAFRCCSRLRVRLRSASDPRHAVLVHESVREQLLRVENCLPRQRGSRSADDVSLRSRDVSNFGFCGATGEYPRATCACGNSCSFVRTCVVTSPSAAIRRTPSRSAQSSSTD